MSRIYSVYLSFKKHRYAFFISYTVLFCVFSLLVFWYFPYFHKSFIWQQDGLKQHYNGLLYYSKYLKALFHGVFAGEGFKLPMWDFSIGYGSDIITTLHYYAIGDPLTLLSVFVPVSVMEFFYAFLFFLRSYLGGLGFSLLSLERGNSRFYTLIGAFIYCFAAFGLILGLMHGIFMVPVCYFPWMIYGTDRIFKKGSPAVFILSVAAAAAANFYFFYMEIVLLMLYIAHKFFCEEQDRYSVRPGLKTVITDFLKRFAEFLIYGLDAFLLSAVILLPVLNVMFSSKRFAAQKYVPVLYSLKHYLTIAADLMITRRAGNWTLMGFTAVGVFSVMLIFTYSGSKREIKRIRLRFIVLTAFAMIPACGFALNGFAYVTNRWTFAWALSAAVVTATVLSDKKRIDYDRKEYFYRILFIFAWATAAFFFVRSEESLLSLVLLFALSMAVLNEYTPKGLYKGIFFTVLTMSLFLNGWYAYSTADSKFLDEFKDFHQADRELNDTTYSDMADELNDGGFFRTEIAGPGKTQNNSIQTGFKGTQFYFSLTSPYISDFINSMYMNWPKDYDYEGVEHRAGLEALANVKYFMAGEDDSWVVPSGFKEISKKDTDKGRVVIYENENALPPVYTTDRIINPDDFDKALVTGRQKALVSGAVPEKDDFNDLLSMGYKVGSFKDDSVDVLKSIEKKGDMDITGNSFTVRKNAGVEISFEGTDEAETYLFFSNLQFQGYNERQKYDDGAWAGLTPYEQAKVRDRNTTDSRPSVTSLMIINDGHENIVEFYNERNDFYCGRKNFLVNLGVTGKGEKTATISFREPGIYTFDSLEVRSQNVESVFKGISEMREVLPEDIEITGDKISCSLDTDKARLLMLSVPYSTGWSAFVDGVKTRVYRADLMYMAVPVANGIHSIELRYETPLLRTGAYLTLIGIILFFVLSWYRKIQKKDKG